MNEIRYRKLDCGYGLFYVYFFAILGKTIAGMVVQFKNMKKGGNFNGEFGYNPPYEDYIIDEYINKKTLKNEKLKTRKE